jgi:hypothetical protein
MAVHQTGLSNNVKICTFCKADLALVGKTNEHILPQWLQREWNLSDDIVQPTHLDEKFEVISMRHHTVGSFVAGRVCALCNNGWMAKLESECKDLILSLAYGRRRIIELNDEEALRLGRWTAKTAYVLHTSSNWRPVVPDAHIYKLDTNDYRLPENVFVVGHTFKSSRDFSWAQTTQWEIFQKDCEIQSEDVAKLKAEGYKIAIRLGGLFLMVFYNPLSFARTCLWTYRHIPLYPRWSHPTTWRIGNHPWPHQPGVRFHAFVHFLGLSIGIPDKHDAATK